MRLEHFEITKFDDTTLLVKYQDREFVTDVRLEQTLHDLITKAVDFDNLLDRVFYAVLAIAYEGKIAEATAQQKQREAQEHYKGMKKRGDGRRE